MRQWHSGSVAQWDGPRTAYRVPRYLHRLSDPYSPLSAPSVATGRKKLILASKQTVPVYPDTYLILSPRFRWRLVGPASECHGRRIEQVVAGVAELVDADIRQMSGRKPV